MLVLGLDTSSQVASCSVLKDGLLLGEMVINHPKTHSQKLMPIVVSLLEKLDIKVKDLDYIAVANGPGSFTGVRIGLSTAKGLAHANDIPMIEVSSLEGLVYNIPFYQGTVCPIFDARRGQVYSALYQWKENKYECVFKEGAYPLEEVLAKTEGKVLFMGDGVAVYREKVLEILGDRAEFAPGTHLLQKSSSLTQAALAKITEAKAYDDVHANYLRKSEAELTYEKKHGKIDE